jgi:hypothetical protein
VERQGCTKYGMSQLVSHGSRSSTLYTCHGILRLWSLPPIQIKPHDYTRIPIGHACPRSYGLTKQPHSTFPDSKSFPKDPLASAHFKLHTHSAAPMQPMLAYSASLSAYLPLPEDLCCCKVLVACICAKAWQLTSVHATCLTYPAKTSSNPT